MTEQQQKIINKISSEISVALDSCEHSRHESGGNPDQIDSYMKSYEKRVKLLRNIRDQLENEFTTIHYDPR